MATEIEPPYESSAADGPGRQQTGSARRRRAKPSSSNGVEHPLRPRTVAVVSGKGGSGKTIIAAEMARILDASTPVTLVDADTGTGGLSYYLGIKSVENTTVGLVNIFEASSGPALVSAASPARKSATRAAGSSLGPLAFPRGSVQPMRNRRDTLFVPVGDIRRLYELQESAEPPDIPGFLEALIRQLAEQQRWVIIDCRGGIDHDSVAVCRAADDILLIVETDTTSIQASTHVVDVLATAGLSNKLRGFVLNKVFNDPAELARTGNSFFRCSFIGAIPFDIRTMQSFLIGDVPQTASLVGAHVWNALHTVYPDAVPAVPFRTWSFGDFREVGLLDLDSLRGGYVLAGLLLALGAAMVPRFLDFVGPTILGPISTPLLVLIALIFIVGFIASIDGTRRFVGRSVASLGRGVSARLEQQAERRPT